MFGEHRHVFECFCSGTSNQNQVDRLKVGQPILANTSTEDAVSSVVLSVEGQMAVSFTWFITFGFAYIRMSIR
jgi:hypothetical protein